MSVETDAADILESAAFVIGTGHHAKRYAAVSASKRECNTYSKEACAWCAIGAIDAAYETLGTSCSAFATARDALRQAIGGFYIVPWNDAPERTPEEVEAAMLKAAAKLRGEA